LYDPATRSGYVQDGEAGIYFTAEPGTTVPAVWSTVEVTGVLQRRGDSAVLHARRFRILPAAAPSPEPALQPASALRDAALHGTWLAKEGTWVAMEGVVTAVHERNGGRTHTLEIDGGGATFTACIAEPKDRPVGREDILGFRVRAQGIVASRFDAAADEARCQLLLPTRVFLRLLQDAPLASTATPPALRTINTIRALSPDDAARRTTCGCAASSRPTMLSATCFSYRTPPPASTSRLGDISTTCSPATRLRSSDGPNGAHSRRSSSGRASR
jgi:hypothetical protein